MLRIRNVLFVNFTDKLVKTKKLKLYFLISSSFKSLYEIHYYNYLFTFLENLGVIYNERLVLNLCFFYCLIHFFKAFLKNLKLILLVITMTFYLNVYKK